MDRDISDLGELFGAPLARFLNEEVYAVGKRRSRQHPGIDADDFRAEMWCEVLDQKVKVIEIWNGPTGRLGIHYFLENVCRDLWQADQDYRRAIKALKGGYKPEDEQIYTKKQLRVLLCAYFDLLDDNGILMGSLAEADQNGGIRTSRPAESGNLHAMLMDLHTALQKLEKKDQLTIRGYFKYYGSSRGHGPGDYACLPLSHEEIAKLAGVEPGTLSKRVSRALDKLAAKMSPPLE